MDTVVTSMTSTESQLKDLEKQALQLQRIAEQEAQEKAAQEAAAQNKQSKLLKMRKLNQHKRHLLSQQRQQTTVDKLKKKSLKGRA